MAALIVFACIILSCLPDVYSRPSWGPSGHQAVAGLAQLLLSPDAEAGVLGLLPNCSGSLEAVASWADVIRQQPQWAWTFGLHFCDIPDWQCFYNPSSDCHSEQFPTQPFCVDAAIHNFTRQAADPLIALDARSEALKFVVHFIGDAHQPLHAGFASDYGGNLINGTFFGMATELHAIWDDWMIDRRILQDFQGDYDQWKAFLMGRLKSTPYETIDEWQDCGSDSSPFSACSGRWVNESAALACAVAYRYANGTVIENNFTIDDKYYQARIPVIETRIMQAGVRLANVLDEIFNMGDAKESGKFALKDRPIKGMVEQ